jgi:hypothetical protein
MNTGLWIIVVVLAVAAAWLAWEVVNLKQAVSGVPLGDDELYDLMHRIDNELGLHDAAIADLQRRVLHLEQLSVTSLRRTGVISYDAYDDVGGARSRSIALLDDEESGLVVTVLVSRTETSFYLKKITAGTPEEPLSPEEQQAISRALQQ